LLIGGPSGVGKSTVAKRIARRFGVDWLQVDDLRLALEASRARLPDPGATRKLFFFGQPGVWRLPPERLRDGFIGVGEALTPALAKVVSNHLAIAEPVVLEGDGILPSLLADPEVRRWDGGGRVRAVFVVAPDEAAMLANMLARGRGITGRSEAELRANARANWLFGQWLGGEALRLGVPVVAPEPWETLAYRIVGAAGATP
jgi:2-phosphoglycerate kinase